MSKKIMKAKLLLTVIVMFCVFGLTACNGQDMDVLIHDEPELSNEAGQNTAWSWDIPKLWYDTCIVCKRWAPVVIVGSILLGIILLEIFKTNKEIQKFAWMVLIIKIPLIAIIFVYMYSFLYGVFNF